MFFRGFAILATVATAYGFTSFPNGPEAENIGEVDTLDAFLAFIGREPSSWEDITVYDNATDLRANPDPVAGDNYGSNPLDSLTNVQERDTCHKRNGWEKIICEDMPNHKWHWSSGNAFPIRYHSDKLMTWLESLAKNIKEGKDIRDKWRDGKDLDDDLTKRRNLGPVASNSSSLRFAVPGHLGPLSERGIDKNGIHSHYLYNREVGEVWYQGTTASFVDDEPILEPQTTSNSSAEAKPSQSFTLVLQVWRKSEAMPASSLSEQCMAKVMHWHIDRASHTQRFICTQLDARGDWWAWYNVNINHGMHMVQTNGACCAN